MGFGGTELVQPTTHCPSGQPPGVGRKEEGSAVAAGEGDGVCEGTLHDSSRLRPRRAAKKRTILIRNSRILVTSAFRCHQKVADSHAPRGEG
jgi:hypothetical protein